MVKPDLDLWTGTDPIFRVVNRFCILCLIGSRVVSGNGRVGFFLLLTPKTAIAVHWRTRKTLRRIIKVLVLFGSKC
ncbi:hypothetical protein HanPI659440_Chr01g0031441 [Helianthus annuus]|nr:hypothetical protein HanPI659440_Chr01g0031441 [Helianthus annuus]